MDLIVDFPQRSSAQKTTNVGFKNGIEVKHVKNLAREYKNELWFSRHDMKLFRVENMSALKQIKSRQNMTLAEYAEKNIDDTSQFMGLESYLTDDAPVEISMRRKRLREAILKEQECQIYYGLHDPERMSIVSQEKSEWARMRARIIGLLHFSE